MSNPVVLITGALTGIGRATALAFAKEGARLVVAGRRQDAGRQLTAELRALGAEAEFIRADVRHEEIGRASCRERVYISVVAVSLKKKKKKRDKRLVIEHNENGCERDVKRGDE